MKILVRSNLWDILHKQNIQVSASVPEELDEFITRMISVAIDDIKNTDHNIKRIDGEMLISHMIKTVKKYNNGEATKPCQRCGAVKDIFIKAAKDLQVLVTDEAKIALMALEKGEKYVK